MEFLRLVEREGERDREREGVLRRWSGEGFGEHAKDCVTN